MTYARRFACLILGLAVLMALPARADDLVRVDVPDGFKEVCHRNGECQAISTTCDSDVPHCCEYDTLLARRSDDYNRLKSKECGQSSSLARPLQCTICEPDVTHVAICQKNKCVYTGGNVSSGDRRATSKSQDPNQTKQQDVNQ
jgi:hypothetical protein